MVITEKSAYQTVKFYTGRDQVVHKGSRILPVVIGRREIDISRKRDNCMNEYSSLQLTIAGGVTGKSLDNRVSYNSE